MMYLGDFEEGQDINFGFSTYDADGESVTITSSDGIRIFRDDSTSGDTDPGTLSVDAYFTGAHKVFVDGDDSYLDDGCDYIVVLENAVIAAKTVNLVIAHFSIENRVTAPSATAIVNAIEASGSSVDQILVDTGTTLPALISAGCTGTGSITFTYTLTETIGGAAIPDAKVWATSDIGGNTVVASGRTNASGEVVFYLDADTYYIWRQKSSYNFTNPDTEVVS